MPRVVYYHEVVGSYLSFAFEEDNKWCEGSPTSYTLLFTSKLPPTEAALRYVKTSRPNRGYSLAGVHPSVQRMPSELPAERRCFYISSVLAVQIKLLFTAQKSGTLLVANQQLDKSTQPKYAERILEICTLRKVLSNSPIASFRRALSHPTVATLLIESIIIGYF